MERRLVIDLADIDLIVYVCPDCGAETGGKASNGDHLPPTQCLACGKDLRQRLGSHSPAMLFIQSLQSLIEPQQSERVRLVVRTENGPTH